MNPPELRSPIEPIIITESRFVTTAPLKLLVHETNRTSTEAYFTISSISSAAGPSQQPSRSNSTLPPEDPIFKSTIPLPPIEYAWSRATNVVINEVKNDNRAILNFKYYPGWWYNMYNLSRGATPAPSIESARHICRFVQTRDWGCNTVLYFDINKKDRIVMKGMWTWNRGERHAGIYYINEGNDGELLIARITSGPFSNPDNSYEVEIPAKVDYGLVATMCLLMDEVHRAQSSKRSYDRINHHHYHGVMCDSDN